MKLINQSLIKYMITPSIWIFIFVLLKNTSDIQWYIALSGAFLLIQITNLVFTLLLKKYGNAFPEEVIYYAYDEITQKVHNAIVVIIATLSMIIFVIFWDMNEFSIQLFLIIVCVAVLAYIYSWVLYYAIYGEFLNLLRILVYTIINIVCMFIVIDYLYFNLSFSLLGVLIPVAIYVYLFVKILLKYFHNFDYEEDEEKDKRYKIQ